MSDDDYAEAKLFPERPPNFPMSKSEYKGHLSRLVRALVYKHGELTVRAVHEMANQMIARHGIRDAADRV